MGTTTGPPQLIPVAAASGLSNAASSSEAQEKFLLLMGLTIATLDIQSDNIFDDSEAELIATALSYSATLPGDVDDTYFTPHEWSLYQKKAASLLDGIHEAALSSEKLNTDSPLEKEARCNCIAHQSEEDIVWKLINIPDQLTDDWGNKLVTNLLPEIFMRSDLHKIDMEDCKQGSVYAVNYILQLPSGGKSAVYWLAWLHNLKEIHAYCGATVTEGIQ